MNPRRLLALPPRISAAALGLWPALFPAALLAAELRLDTIYPAPNADYGAIRVAGDAAVATHLIRGSGATNNGRLGIGTMSNLGAPLNGLTWSPFMEVRPSVWITSNNDADPLTFYIGTRGDGPNNPDDFGERTWMFRTSGPMLGERLAISKTGSAQLPLILKDNRVSIGGDLDPAALLELSGGGSGQRLLEISRSDDYGQMLHVAGAAPPNVRVGVGTNGPTQTFVVNGSAGQTSGDADWADLSDVRAKNLLGPWTAGLSEVRRLEVLRFRFKEGNRLGIDAAEERVGLAAQAVRAVLPQAVREDAEGNLLLDSDPIFGAMINAVKEQSSRLRTMEERLRLLESRLEGEKP